MLQHFYTKIFFFQRIETFLWKNVDYLVTESTTSVIKKPQGGKLPSNAHTVSKLNYLFYRRKILRKI